MLHFCHWQIIKPESLGAESVKVWFCRPCRPWFLVSSKVWIIHNREPCLKGKMPGEGWNGYQIILLRLLFSSLILRAFCYASVSNRSASSLLLSVTATHLFGFPVPCCLLPEQSFLTGLESNRVEAVHYAWFVDRFAFFGPPCPLLAASSRRLLLYLRVVKMHKPGKRPKWIQMVSKNLPGRGQAWV